MMKHYLTLLVLAAGFAPSAFAQHHSDSIEAVTIHPPVAATYQCSEHALGAEDHAGDALGADCVVVRRDGGPDGRLLSLYTGDGTRNEDWHSWGEPLLAPFDGVVTLVYVNPETTVPGVWGEGRSSAVLFKRIGGDQDVPPVQVGYVHVQDVLVAEGDTVTAGQPVAHIGNNGSSWHPHVHIGAFRGELFSDEAVPLQIRMDLEALGRLRGTLDPPPDETDG
jgi:hypothetical protein